MGVKTKDLNELFYNEKLQIVYDKYETRVNFRFDYIFRTSLSARSPDRLCEDLDNPALDQSQKDILPYITNARGISNVTILRQELKMLKTEENLKRKEMNIVVITEDGLRKNIKHLEDIILIKENFITETTNYSSVRSNAKDKVQRELYKTNKKLNKIVSEFSKTSDSNSGIKHSGSEGIGSRVRRYENKMKRMTDIIQAASESQEKLYQYGNALQVSKDRLTMFNVQLIDLLKHKQEILFSIKDNQKQINQLKIKLSNFEILASIERCRIHTSSCFVEEDYLKQEFLNMQDIRDEILSIRPKGMFNPKYQKVNSLTKEEIRHYLENDEVIDTVDYLIELKNNALCKNGKNLLNCVDSNSNETKVFLKCLSTLNRDEFKGLIIHYYTKVVDLKESGKESDELIAKLDEIINRQRRDIGFLKNDFQNFHLSFEKKFASLKKHYEDKLNMLFQILQEENTAITVYKLRDEIIALKKKINQLERNQLVQTKTPLLTQDNQPQKSSEKIDTSKSGSESLSATKVTYHKNKLKIQKTKPK